MKTAKKLLALILALAMVLTVAVPAFAETKSGYKYLTVLGDSNASGYGLDAYFENAGSTETVKEGDLIDGSYPALLAKAFGIDKENVNMRSHSGWRTNEFLYTLLGKDCGVSYSEYFRKALNFVSPETLVGEGARLKEAIEKADIITVDFGSNDIYSYAIAVLTTDIYPHLEDDCLAIIQNVLTELGASATPDELQAALISALGNVEFAAEVFEAFRACLRQNFEEYKVNIVKVIDAIRYINKDAKILLLGFFCPISLDIKLSGGSSLDIYTISDRFVDEVNAYLKDECPARGEYTYVDISKTECFGLPALDFGKLLPFDEDIKYSAVKMVHPTLAGHQYIADQILNTLSAEPITLAVSASYSKYLKRITLKWDKMSDAKAYVIYRSCSENGKYLPIGTSLNGTFIDLLTLKGHSYYYKVIPVMGANSSINIGFSDIVSVTAK